MPNYTMNAAEWGMLILISVIWGASFFFIEVALREVGPFTLVLYRIGVAAVVVTSILYISGRHLPFDAASWRMYFALGALNNFIPFSLISWGQVRIDSGLASILNATTPMFSVIVAHFLAGEEQMTRNRIAGVLSGITGVALLVGPEALSGLSGNLLGQLAVLGAAFSYACGGSYARRLSGMPVLVAMSGTLVAATIMIGCVVLIREFPPRVVLQPSTVGALLWLSVLGTAFAYLLYFRLIRTAGATNTLLVTLLVPVTAVVMGVSFLDEPVTRHALWGMLLIFLGLALVDGRLVGRWSGRG